MTGIAPAELMFKRKIKTKLPEFREKVEINEDEVRDRDQLYKEKSRIYTDTKRSAKESEIKPGDVVLLQQQKQNKLSATYENVPYKVIQKDGNSVLVKSPEEVHVRRNSTQVRKYVRRESEEVPKFDLGDKEEGSIPAEHGSSDKSVIESQNVKPNINERPSRTRVMPKRFEDYVLKDK